MLDSRRRRVRRRGQSLIEFALVALVVYMLLAAILTFGHALFVAQGLQSAANLGAAEIARTPLPPDITLDNPADDAEPGALHHDDVRREIFDQSYLVIDLDVFYATPTVDGTPPNFFVHAVPQMPRLNQQLAMLMIVDRPDFNGDGTPDAWLLRYPGALLSRAPSLAPPTGVTYPGWVASQYAVGIPLVTSRTPVVAGGGGIETIRWVPIVEEIDSEASADEDTPPNPDPFRISSSQRGIVALRINYPFQSASMSGFEGDPDDPFAPSLGRPIAADDKNGTLTELNTSERPGDLLSAPLSDGERYAGTYGGRYGLGAQGAMGSDHLTGGRPVRPFRRVISAQAIYRREVFATP